VQPVRGIDRPRQALTHRSGARDVDPGDLPVGISAIYAESLYVRLKGFGFGPAEREVERHQALGSAKRLPSYVAWKNVTPFAQAIQKLYEDALRSLIWIKISPRLRA
jgi:hypothetical protein